MRPQPHNGHTSCLIDPASSRPVLLNSDGACTYHDACVWLKVTALKKCAVIHTSPLTVFEHSTGIYHRNILTINHNTFLLVAHLYPMQSNLSQSFSIESFLSYLWEFHKSVSTSGDVDTRTLFKRRYKKIHSNS